MIWYEAGLEKIARNGIILMVEKIFESSVIVTDELTEVQKKLTKVGKAYPRCHGGIAL